MSDLNFLELEMVFLGKISWMTNLRYLCTADTVGALVREQIPLSIKQERISFAFMDGHSLQRRAMCSSTAAKTFRDRGLPPICKHKCFDSNQIILNFIDRLRQDRLMP